MQQGNASTGDIGSRRKRRVENRRRDMGVKGRTHDGKEHMELVKMDG